MEVQLQCVRLRQCQNMRFHLVIQCRYLAVSVFQTIFTSSFYSTLTLVSCYFLLGFSDLGVIWRFLDRHSHAHVLSTASIAHNSQTSRNSSSSLLYQGVKVQDTMQLPQLFFIHLRYDQIQSPRRIMHLMRTRSKFIYGQQKCCYSIPLLATNIGPLFELHSPRNVSPSTYLSCRALCWFQSHPSPPEPPVCCSERRDRVTSPQYLQTSLFTADLRLLIATNNVEGFAGRYVHRHLGQLSSRHRDLHTPVLLSQDCQTKLES